MKKIAFDLLKILSLREISIPGLVAISVSLGMLAALIVPVTVR